jgi:hypothetical protein
LVSRAPSWQNGLDKRATIPVHSAQASQPAFGGSNLRVWFGAIWTNSPARLIPHETESIVGDLLRMESGVSNGRRKTGDCEREKLSLHAVWGHGKTSAGNEGLTDHSPRDLYGTVAPLQFAFEDAGKDLESLSGPAAKPPDLLGAAAGSARFSSL